MPDRWTEYIDASHRKIAIAEFHCEQLKTALAICRDDASDRPDIPVQAFFEGVITAVISATDQVAQATNSALVLHANSGNLFNVASPAIEARVPCFTRWREQPIGHDLRRLRVRIVHYSYVKSPNADGIWQVETTGTDYHGLRDLSSYADAAVAYAKELGFIADKLALTLLANNPRIAVD